MAKLKIVLNRYDGKSAIAFINPRSIKIRDSVTYIDVPLEDNDEFCILFKPPIGENDEVELDTARQLLAQLADIDNIVQKSSAEECTMSGQHPRNFEGELAYITMSRNRDSTTLLRNRGEYRMG